jgi:hypothetical protein
VGPKGNAGGEQAMKIQEVILRAMAKRITWWQAAEIIGMSRRRAAAGNRPSRFLATRDAGGRVELERVTLVGRALRESEIRMIAAYLRPTRGRSERTSTPSKAV